MALITAFHITTATAQQSDDDLVWVHDYHFIPLARELRQRRTRREALEEERVTVGARSRTCASGLDRAVTVGERAVSLRVRDTARSQTVTATSMAVAPRAWRRALVTDSRARR